MMARAQAGECEVWVPFPRRQENRYVDFRCPPRRLRYLGRGRSHWLPLAGWPQPVVWLTAPFGRRIRKGWRSALLTMRQSSRGVYCARQAARNCAGLRFVISQPPVRDRLYDSANRARKILRFRRLLGPGQKGASLAGLLPITRCPHESRRRVGILCAGHLPGTPKKLRYLPLG